MPFISQSDDQNEATSQPCSPLLVLIIFDTLASLRLCVRHSATAPAINLCTVDVQTGPLSCLFPVGLLRYIFNE